MSTRGFFTIVIDQHEKTVFNHWDSYPAGLGADVLTWLRGRVLNDLPGTLMQARSLRLISEGTAPAGTMYDVRRSPQDLLDAGVAIDDGTFPLDSLFAEWGYVVNLDEMVFEVYRGFQTVPHDHGRFASRSPYVPSYHNASNNVYYPVALVASWSLAQLPSDDVFNEMSQRVHDEEEAAYEALHDGNAADLPQRGALA